MRKILKGIMIFFSLLFGFQTSKRREEYQEPVAISAKSKEQEQDELGKWLEEECIAYDPNSPEARAESAAIFSLFDEHFALDDFQVERGYVEDEERPQLLSEEEADKLFNKHNYGSTEEEHIH